jgi:hypothetical protein
VPRRWLVAALIAAAVAVAAVTVVVVRRDDGSTGVAARLLGPLPAGYAYIEMEADEAEATDELFRDRHGARDVEVTLVDTPQDLAPVGVAVVAMELREPPDPLALARDLERDVPLVDPQPKSLGGQPVLSHEGDATLSSATLWVQGRLALLAYGSTTAEVDGVMTGILESGAWRAVAR